MAEAFGRHHSRLGSRIPFCLTVIFGRTADALWRRPLQLFWGKTTKAMAPLLNLVPKVLQSDCG